MSIQKPPVSIPDTEMLSISSSQIEQEFCIFVALPHSYAESDKVYPVLYLLDANAFFGTVTETARALTILAKD